MAHFTAWLTTDPSCLDGDVADVTILQDDEIDSGWINADATSDAFYYQDPAAVLYTNVPAGEGRLGEAKDEAEELLEHAGWRLESDWTTVSAGAFVTVVGIPPQAHFIAAQNSPHDSDDTEVASASEVTVAAFVENPFTVTVPHVDDRRGVVLASPATDAIRRTMFQCPVTTTSPVG